MFEHMSLVKFLFHSVMEFEKQVPNCQVKQKCVAVMVPENRVRNVFKGQPKLFSATKNSASGGSRADRDAS